MLMSSLMKRVTAILVSLSFLVTYSLPAYSGIVTTEQLIQEQLETLDKPTLVSMLDRDEVRQQLVDRGVDPDYAKQRIAALSDEQIHEIKSNIDELPAGSSVVGILIAVLLVLVILDIVGVTNIFTFINPAR
ncbi:MAG: PA2779 family protein [Thiogranum sp.]